MSLIICKTVDSYFLISVHRIIETFTSGIFILILIVLYCYFIFLIALYILTVVRISFSSSLVLFALEHTECGEMVNT
jgi:hypothetical protein